MRDIKLPEVGENITSGTVVSVFVSVGDTIKKDQDLIELETDKASLPVPSPCAGVVKEILVAAGNDVKIGAVIMRVEESLKGTDSEKSQTPQASSAGRPEQKKAVQQETQNAAKVPTPQPVAAPQRAANNQQPETKLNPDQHVAIIGGGPGGYVAAFMAAELGLKVSLIDKDINPGGVCLYRGCIPSKALLHAAKILSEAKEAKHFGIDFGEPKIDLDKLRNWKNDVVKKLTGGLGSLTKQRKITYIQGTASFIDSNTVKVTKEDGSTENLKYDKAILATGSRPIALPFAPKSERVLDSTSALNITNIPKTMLLIGGGYIGLELGTVYAGLGTELDVVEMLPTLMAGADRDVASILEKRLKTILKEIMVETKVLKMEETKSGILVTFEDKSGKQKSKEYEKVLVAIGRRPNNENLGLENTKVQLDEKGFVKINAQRLTDDDQIYAIGDLAGQPMLAHKASHEGIVAAEAILGKRVAFEPATIPAVVFTDPEIAWCGITETEAKQKGIEVDVQKFPWAASGRAITLDRTDGMTKLLIDPKTERILGVSIVGVGAGEMIAEGVLAIEMGAVAADLKMTIHPHPTLSETMMETAEGFYGHSMHIYKPKKK